ncbi:hypothetical protein GBA52_028516 [Prunus armeniaca]|nr:hypothetical protein GBA52_028516 [Prunus armeniaca]
MLPMSGSAVWMGGDEDDAASWTRSSSNNNNNNNNNEESPKRATVELGCFFFQLQIDVGR